MSSPFVAALVRGLVGALIVGAIDFLTEWDPDVRDTLDNAVRAGLIAGFLYLSVRAGIEGGGDQIRTWTGTVFRSDVPEAIDRQR